MPSRSAPFPKLAGAIRTRSAIHKHETALYIFEVNHRTYIVQNCLQSAFTLTAGFLLSFAFSDFLLKFSSPFFDQFFKMFAIFA